MTKKTKLSQLKSKLKEKSLETEAKNEKLENKNTRHLYLLSGVVLFFLGLNGYLLFTEPAAVKDMYEYNSKVEAERMKLAEYKTSLNPEDQTKYDEENHQLETTLKEKQQQAEKLEKTAEIAKKTQEDMDRRVQALTKIKESNDLNQYVEALNSDTYPYQGVKDRASQRQAFENQAEAEGGNHETK